MKAIDRRQVRRHFSVSAKHYDGHAVVQKRVAQKVAERVLQTAPPGGRFLDVGTGTGALSDIIFRSRPALRPIVADMAHSMTLHASRRLQGAAAIDLDATALPLATACLPVICSASVYQWVEDLPGAFRECWRVLQPQGIFAFALFGDRTLWELKACYREASRCELGREAGHLHEMPSWQMVEHALRCGGFARYEMEEGLECERHASLAGLLRSIKGVGAQNASPRRPGGLASRKVMDRVAEIYRQRYCEEGELCATYHVIYGVAYKQ